MAVIFIVGVLLKAVVLSNTIDCVFRSVRHRGTALPSPSALSYLILIYQSDVSRCLILLVGFCLLLVVLCWCVISSCLLVVYLSRMLLYTSVVEKKKKEKPIKVPFVHFFS